MQLQAVAREAGLFDFDRSTESDQIEVAYGDIAGLSARQADTLLRALEPHERARAARFAGETPRRLYVLAHAMLRVELARVFGCRPQLVGLASRAHGKPYVVAPTPAPEISMTHGGTMAACAITWAGDVGIDVEPTGCGALDLEFARQQFSADEVARLAGLNDDRLMETLVAIWTAKEAILKALGAGLSMPLDRFSVPARDGCVAGPEEIGVWRVRRLAPDPVHRLAVALSGDPSRPVSMHERAWSAEALVAVIGSAFR